MALPDTIVQMLPPHGWPIALRQVRRLVTVDGELRVSSSVNFINGYHVCSWHIADITTIL
jgi:hypothetical protein